MLFEHYNPKEAQVLQEVFELLKLGKTKAQCKTFLSFGEAYEGLHQGSFEVKMSSSAK